MKLETLDMALIILYMIAITVIGFIMKKRAEQGEREYLLGGNRNIFKGIYNEET